MGDGVPGAGDSHQQAGENGLLGGHLPTHMLGVAHPGCETRDTVTAGAAKPRCQKRQVCGLKGDLSSLAVCAWGAGGAA